MDLSEREITLLQDYLGEEYAMRLLRDYENAKGMDRRRLEQLVLWELGEAEDEATNTDVEDTLPVALPVVDSNGNWQYSFSFDGSDIVYVVWNDTRVFQGNVEVGYVDEFGVNFFPIN
jgi:hypothetical protein